MSKGQFRPDNPTLLPGELFIPRVDQHGNMQTVPVDADGYAGGSTSNAVTASTFTVPTGTATAIGSGSAITGVLVQSLATNSANIYIGGVGVTTSTGLELIPGATLSLSVNNIAIIYAVSGTANQVLRIMRV